MANESARELVDRYLRSGQTRSQIAWEATELVSSYEKDGLTAQADRERAVAHETRRRQ